MYLYLILISYRTAESHTLIHVIAVRLTVSVAVYCDGLSDIFQSA